MWVQNVLGYFAFWCRISGLFCMRVEYPRIFCSCGMSQGIQLVGVECRRIFCMRVQNVLGYFACGCKMSQDILHAGVKCPRIFCMVQSILEQFPCWCRISNVVSETMNLPLLDSANQVVVAHLLFQVSCNTYQNVSMLLLSCLNVCQHNLPKP